jgi:hypothetical protein
LARLSLRLPDGETLVAHVPQEELNGAGEGDTVRIDLRNPKAFARTEAEVPPEVQPEIDHAEAGAPALTA